MKEINKKLIIFLIMGLLVNQPQVKAIPVMLIVGIIQFAWSAFEMLDSLHDTHSKFTTPSTVDLMEKTEELANSVAKWGGRLEAKIDQTVSTLLTRLPLMGEIANDIRLLNTYIGRIDELYSDMIDYARRPDKFSETALRELLDALRSRDGDDLQGSINQMYSLIVPQGLALLKPSMFVLLAKETQDNELGLCGTGQSPQGRLLSLFDIAMESEMRAFAMLGFGYMMDEYLTDGAMTNLTMKGGMRLGLRKLTVRAKKYAQVLKQTMAIATTKFRRCDPLRHERGVTFLEFDRFLQGFVLLENVLWGGSCRGCALAGKGLAATTKHGCQGIGCSRDTPDACRGRLTECDTMKSRAAVCDTSAIDTRRYGWFADEDGNVFGDNTDGCSGNVTIASGRGNCRICRCICVDDSFRTSSSNRFISLREQVTDVDNNMVTTGLAFVMINRILHLKMRQGKLLPRGEIDENTTAWMEPEHIEYDLEKSMRVYSPKFVLKSEGNEDQEMKEGSDVVALKWEIKRIGLDSLTLPENHLLTGVRFRQFGGIVRLEIRGTEADDETGLLKPESSIWITPDDMPHSKRKKARSEYEQTGTLNPTESADTYINSSPYSYLDLHWSSIELDGAQTTIPLLDSLPVITDPPIPLVGAALYHKSQAQYGGFLTLVLEGIDQSPYIPEV